MSDQQAGLTEDQRAPGEITAPHADSDRNVGDVSKAADASAGRGDPRDRTASTVGSKPHPNNPDRLQSAAVAGEDEAEFARLLNSVIDEQGARTASELFLAEQAAHCQWKARRLWKASSWIWIQAIGKAVFAHVVDISAEQVLEDKRKRGEPAPLQRDEDITGTFRQKWWRSWQNVAFAAASGKKDAIEAIEKELGPGTVALNARVDFESVLNQEMSLERLLEANNATMNSAYRGLRKRRKESQIKPGEDCGRSAADQTGADVTPPSQSAADDETMAKATGAAESSK